MLLQRGRQLRYLRALISVSSDKFWIPWCVLLLIPPDCMPWMGRLRSLDQNIIMCKIQHYFYLTGNLCWAQPRAGLVLPVREDVAMFCSAHRLWRLRQLAQRSKDHSDNWEPILDCVMDTDGERDEAQWCYTKLLNLPEFHVQRRFLFLRKKERKRTIGLSGYFL